MRRTILSIALLAAVTVNVGCTETSGTGSGASAQPDAVDTTAVPGPDADLDVPTLATDEWTDTPAADVADVVCPSVSLAAGDHLITVDVGGATRSFIAYVPSPLPPGGRPLLFNFHGYNSNASQQMAYSNARHYADLEGYVVLAPEGTSSDSAQSFDGGECCPPANVQEVDELAFIRAALEWARTQVCVDEKRIFAMGMSNGAFMSHRVACEMGDVFAAIGPVAGVGPTAHDECLDLEGEAACNGASDACASLTSRGECLTADSPICTWNEDTCIAGCTFSDGQCLRRFVSESDFRDIGPDPESYPCPARPGGVPVYHVHGTSDAIIPWKGIEQSWGRYASVDESIAHWLERNGCSGEPTLERLECPAGDPSCNVDGRCAAKSPDASAIVKIRCSRESSASACSAMATCAWNASGSCVDCRDVVCRRWKCTGSDVTLCENENGGHCWPGGESGNSEAAGCSAAAGADGLPYSATHEIFAFFAAHPMP